MPRVNRAARRPAGNPGRKSRAAASVLPSDTLLIEIPDTLGLVRIEGRQELQLRGRVVAAAPLAGISVLQHDAVIFRIRYDVARADNDHRRCFVCNLRRSAAQSGEPWQFEIVADHPDGRTERAAFVAGDGDGSTARVLSGPTVPMVAADDPLPPIILKVEQARLDPDNRLLVHGWAIGIYAIETVRVWVGHDWLGDAALGLPRPDVAGWRSEYGNAARSGFALSVHVHGTEPPGGIRVEAHATGGQSVEIVLPLDRTDRPTQETAPAAGEIFDPRRDIGLFCDEAVLSADGRLTVVGWAICATGISGVTVSADGEAFAEAEFGLLRHDVGDEYVTIPMARHSGFRFNRDIPGVAEQLALRIIARNGLGDTSELVLDLRRAEAVEPPVPAAPVPGRTEFRLQIDSPAMVDGVVQEPVSGRLTIDGWALCRAGVAAIEVVLDGQVLGDAHYGLARQDVAHAFPDWPHAIRSGFAFPFPPRLLRNGTHVAELRVRAANDQVLARPFRFEVHRADDAGEGASIRRRIPRVEAEFYAGALERLDARPRFRVVLVLSDQVERGALDATLDSLDAQVLRDWRLVMLAPDPDAAREAQPSVADRPAEFRRRIDIIEAVTAWPAGQPNLICFLSPGDELGCDALVEIGLAWAMAPGTDLLYADEARVSPVSNEREPFFKPGFSPDLLLATNYIGRPWFATPALLKAARATPATLLAAGEYRRDPALHRTGAGSDARSEAAVPARFGGAGHRRAGTPGIGQSCRPPGCHSRGPARRGGGKLAGAAHDPGARNGVDHHPDLRRRRSHRGLRSWPPRAHRLSQLRDHLHREHRGPAIALEGMAARQRRYRAERERDFQLVAFQQPRRGPGQGRLSAVPE